MARRMKNQFGEQAKAEPCRDLATPAVGTADIAFIIDDNLDLDVDVEHDSIHPQQRLRATQ